MQQIIVQKWYMVETYDNTVRITDVTASILWYDVFIYLFEAFCDVVYLFSGTGGRRRIVKIEHWGAS